MFYKHVDMFERSTDGAIRRFRCLYDVESQKYCVQNADMLYRDSDLAQLDRLFIELLSEVSPNERAQFFETVEEAIENHKKQFGEIA